MHGAVIRISSIAVAGRHQEGRTHHSPDALSESRVMVRTKVKGEGSP